MSFPIKYKKRYTVYHTLFALCVLVLFSFKKPDKEVVINAKDYGLTQGEDAVPALRKALDACIAQKATKLILPKGKYLCHPSKATEKYIRVSNNDNGMKRIIFPLEDLHNFEIDGQGSQLILHGQMMAFDVEDCENITIKNLSIDWNKPFYFQGEVIATDKATNSFDLKVFEECDYEIVAHELLFLEKPNSAIRTWKRWSVPVEEDYGWEQNIDWNIWYDAKTKTPAFNHGKSILRSYNEELKVRYHAEEIEKGVIRIFNATNVLPKIGWALVVKGRKEKQRISPAVHLFHNKNIRIENVDIHHAGGMGLIGERTENITMVDFNVVLPPSSGRVVTTTADATHFVNCKGLISYDKCLFENMLDDAGNFHGIYTKVDGLVDDYTIGVRRMHGQQTGFQFAEVGDNIRLSDSKPMKPYATLKVVAVKDVNEEYMTIRFEEKVKDILRPSSVADNTSWQADVDMRNSTVRRNRARTLLISTQGNVLIEKNTFMTCTYASLLFEGDATYWHESGPVSNVVIRKNTFKDFGLSGGEAPIIRFTPRVAFDGKPNHYYHKNIIFENNHCEVFGKNFVFARSVENFVCRGNTILPSKSYPLSQKKADVFRFEYSKDIKIENNNYKFEKEATIYLDKYSNAIIKKNKGIEEKVN